MSAIKTFAPCLEKSHAVDSPMPLDPPVISATFPSSLSHFHKMLSLTFIIHHILDGIIAQNICYSTWLMDAVSNKTNRKSIYRERAKMGICLFRLKQVAKCPCSETI